MIAGSSGVYAAKTARDHAVSPAGRRERPPGCAGPHGRGAQHPASRTATAV